ncbi:MAG: Transcriptional regulator, TetR family [Armatimonadetes bacterium]|jgi:AcrR family transcriptional regulator|nr:Transcriptional regulator, TetR family [Armatimonadota bacterium]
MTETHKAETAPEGRRERRARETRRKILQAAVELFAEREMDAVTVEEIATRADVARGTVFNHFANKESLCQGLGELQIEALQDAIQEGRIAGPGVSEKIAHAMRVMCDFPGQDPERCRTFLTRGLASMQPGELPEHRRRWFELLESWVREGQENGELRNDVPPCELAGFIMGLQFQATLVWAYGFVQGTLADHMGRVLGLALDGLRKR